MKTTVLLCMLFITLGTAHGAVMARGKVVLLDSNTSSTGTFGIKVDGAGGYSCNGNPIGISASNFPDAESFKRSFAIAMLAFTMGYTVELHNHPVSASCPYIFAIRIVND